MASVRVMILRTAGTNCDVETAFAFDQAGGVSELIHVNKLIAQPQMLDDFQILAIPGGFSYGDDISAGRIFAVGLRRDLGDVLGQFVQKDKLVIGICNGFQVLVKAGLLPDVQLTGTYEQTVTLTDNDSGRFEDRWVHLRSFSTRCVFIDSGAMIYLPIAHGEGKFVPRDDTVIERLKSNDQIVFRYVDSSGRPGPYPANPNGSIDDIAGICDPSGRILGMMPHPERHIHKTQHPHWTRLTDRGGNGDGCTLFANAIRHFH